MSNELAQARKLLFRARNTLNLYARGIGPTVAEDQMVNDAIWSVKKAQIIVAEIIKMEREDGE
jgi:hypothetical protein